MGEELRKALGVGMEVIITPRGEPGLPWVYSRLGPGVGGLADADDRTTDTWG